MRLVLLVVVASVVSVARGFVSVLLIGPRSETRPLADRYAAFYNVPLLEREVSLYPGRFVVILDGPAVALPESPSVVSVRVEDYPRRGNPDPNYFISWMKQISG